eukprot:CAMPEP_0113521878 /NCGR_PEP_ID=MMETSP0014_2-20120614/44886_1 /TAXON_ID=2857 /ORGANISM="Nitzschia sp." /LENGTH=210 /DNA_ID=CAMNT_0000419889 /DNA_START=336 /DNA_END=964 /DNA_ORIENTATION=- /assembly_acc=CAM_ASM_000159
MRNPDFEEEFEFMENTLAWEDDNRDVDEIRRQRYSFWRSKQLTLPYRLQYLHLNSTGFSTGSRSSTQKGLLAEFSLGMALREVHLAGFDILRDSDFEEEFEFMENTLAWEDDNRDIDEIRRQRYSFWRSKQLTLPYRLQYLYLDSTGFSTGGRSNTQKGLLAEFSLGMALREVHLAGFDISNFEVEALAFNCQETLTVFQMRAGRLSDTG